MYRDPWQRLSLATARKLAGKCLAQLWRLRVYSRKEAYEVLRDVVGTDKIFSMSREQCREMVRRFIVLGLAFDEGVFRRR